MEYANQKGLLSMLREIKEKFPQKDIWCYTGFEFDREIRDDMCQKYEETNEILTYIDVLVDGKFVEEKKDITLKFRGSSNQRIIDVKKSLKTHQVIPYDV